MKILYIAIIAIIIFLIIYGAVPGAKGAIDNAFLGASGEAGKAYYAFAGTVSANPLYIQYHPLLWLVAGAVLFVCFHQLWQRRPVILQRNKVVQTPFQGAPTYTPPTVVQAAKVEKKEEEVPAS